MRFIRNRRGQSMLEYALLLGVVVAAILIMQVFIKRGFMGGLKDSADKLGDAYSAGNTSIQEERIMNENNIIEESVATDGTIDTFVNAGTPEETISEGVYTLNTRRGGQTTTTRQARTDAATGEVTRWDEYDNTEVADFDIPF